ncbi:MAG: hypothetical protein HY289_12930 [Planctomycetes bacterium]|nr:hypothetical protein [Planctomycetota bacterium]
MAANNLPDARRFRNIAFWVVIGTSALAIGAVVAAFLWRTPPNERISEQAFEKLHQGMTELDVQEVIGLPAGNYSREPVIHAEAPRLVRYENEAVLNSNLRTWTARTIEIGVAFDNKGRLAEKWLCRMRPRRNTTYD